VRPKLSTVHRTGATAGVIDPPEAELERLWIVIPAFNEARAIRRVVVQVVTRFPKVVVVDDGSDDNTSAEAVRAGAVVVRHLVNLGQGAALQTGIDYALAAGADLIVTFDADEQHDPDDIPRLVAALRRENAEVALGSRFLGRAPGMPWPRRLLLRAAVWFTNLTSGLRLTDSHNGLRLLTATAARRIRITHNRMAHASEIIDQIGRFRLPYVEVPVTIRYTEYSRRKGQSGLDVFDILLELLIGRIGR
jgi:polyprenyl-phospho-N-acetylgalactosaminyl synthase